MPFFFWHRVLPSSSTLSLAPPSSGASRWHLRRQVRYRWRLRRQARPGGVSVVRRVPVGASVVRRVPVAPPSSGAFHQDPELRPELLRLGYQLLRPPPSVGVAQVILLGSRVPSLGSASPTSASCIRLGLVVLSSAESVTTTHIDLIQCCVATGNVCYRVRHITVVTHQGFGFNDKTKVDPELLFLIFVAGGHPQPHAQYERARHVLDLVQGRGQLLALDGVDAGHLNGC